MCLCLKVPQLIPKTRNCRITRVLHAQTVQFKQRRRHDEKTTNFDEARYQSDICTRDSWRMLAYELAFFAIPA